MLYPFLDWYRKVALAIVTFIISVISSIVDWYYCGVMWIRILDLSCKEKCRLLRVFPLALNIGLTTLSMPFLALQKILIDLKDFLE